jgi:hypothetical protein
VNAATIRAELDQATRLDAQARVHRQRAGILLRQASTLRDMHGVAREVGIDSRMVELLLRMAPLNLPSKPVAPTSRR